MGKRAKSARAEKRKQLKRAQKAARKALYESYAGTGANKKSKRFKLGQRRSKNSLKVRIMQVIPVLVNGVRTLALRSVHASTENCGNVGCRKCFVRV
jgi:hypothetical protein